MMFVTADTQQGWGVSPRGAGYLFGSDVVQHFNTSNDIEMICRAHQLVMEGYKWHFNETVLTVWSAPNYCYRYTSSSCVLLHQLTLIFCLDVEMLLPFWNWTKTCIEILLFLKRHHKRPAAFLPRSLKLIIFFKIIARYTHNSYPTRNECQLLIVVIFSHFYNRIIFLSNCFDQLWRVENEENYRVG
jgi:hypothetical protein